MRSPRGGFSLLEVMLAILLLGMGLAFLLQIISTGLFVGGQNEDMAIAANLAQEKIEELRNAAYASVSNEAKAVVTGFSGTTGSALFPGSPGFPAFQRQVVMTTPQTGLKQISVTVYWTAKSAEMNTNMMTYVSSV